MSRRNLSAVRNMLGLPEEYIVTKYIKGEMSSSPVWYQNSKRLELRYRQGLLFT